MRTHCGKRPFDTRNEAERTLRALIAKRTDKKPLAKAYHCKLCQKFHLGRSVLEGRHERIKDSVGIAARRLRYWAMLGEKA